MKTLIAGAGLAAATLAACKPQQAAPIVTPAGMLSDADAATIADATVAAWTSMDAAKVKALYAPGITGFDVAGPLVADRATWNRNQDAYAAAKFDRAEAVDRKVQILDAATFVLSGVWKMTSTAAPQNDMTIRCTAVFHRDEAGRWPIVNENCSAMPKPA